MKSTSRHPSHRAIALAVVLFCVTALLPGVARADNPIVQNVYTADPAPLVYNGRVYLYTGHDEDDTRQSRIVKDVGAELSSSCPVYR